MGRKAEQGGVKAKGDRIEVTFTWNSKTYRPTLDWRPSATTLKRAAKLREQIVEQIRHGKFSFADHFPDYKFIDRVASRDSGRTWGAVADDYLASIGRKEFATRVSYRRIIDFWKGVKLSPNDSATLAERAFTDVRYSDLARFIGSHPWGTNKTHNNKVSVLKCVFDFGYADIEDKRNPAEKLEMLRVQHPAPDPYTLEEALAVIADARGRYGEEYGNYVEFQFFTGLRPSETIALTWGQIDQRKWSIKVDRARVMGQDKGATKTSVSRLVEACPRVQALLQRQQAITGSGEHVFGEGGAYGNVRAPGDRWPYIHRRLKLRYREPYQCRHTSVSWNLMMGKNVLWVARQHGHSVAMMLKTYATWLEGTTDAEIAALKAAYAERPAPIALVQNPVQN
jgi:integrase